MGKKRQVSSVCVTKVDYFYFPVINLNIFADLIVKVPHNRKYEGFWFFFCVCFLSSKLVLLYWSYV